MANLTIEGVKFTINPNMYNGNYTSSPLVPVETKQISANKPDIDYMQNLANEGKDWQKVVNVIDIDFNGAELSDVDGKDIQISNFAQLINVIQGVVDKLKNHNAGGAGVDVEYNEDDRLLSVVAKNDFNINYNNRKLTIS